MKTKKPIIGIIAKFEKISDDCVSPIFNQNNIKAIEDNGGIPLKILPNSSKIQFMKGDISAEKANISKEETDQLTKQIILCDGILFQGGKFSLTFESWVAKYTFDNDIPTMGFCAGQNVMVRALGGSTKDVDNLEFHYRKSVPEAHKIFIKKDSKFYNIVKTDCMVVNSTHKKIINDHTKYYIVSAVDPDGNPEVLEAPNKKFNFALRFHPERLYKIHEEHRKIWEAFINACKNSRT